VAADQLFFGAAVVDGVGGDCWKIPMSSCSRGTSHASLRQLRRWSSGLGSKSLVMVEGVRLMRILCFVLCVFCFAEPTMESDRWPVVVEGRETDRWRRRSSRCTGVERSDGRDLHPIQTLTHTPIHLYTNTPIHPYYNHTPALPLSSNSS
jgi:hypothetical protein